MPESDRVLDARVHALPARRAVHVRRVSGEQDPCGAVAVRHPVLDAEPGAPQQLVDPSRLGDRPALVQQALHVADRRLASHTA